jgi:2-C-methyl-D-erythritol 2,4-cyclodiphosphate synthase
MNTPINFRIGEGWDVHALVPGRPLVIGGVTIPHPVGLLGHSDADVLLHAITDALAGCGRSGRHRRAISPIPTPAFRSADSLHSCLPRPPGASRQAGWHIGNVDSTVVAQAPRLATHIPAMCARIAQVLGLDGTQVNVKAKTAEKLGPVGQGQAIEARSVVLLFR